MTSNSEEPWPQIPSQDVNYLSSIKEVTIKDVLEAVFLYFSREYGKAGDYLYVGPCQLVDYDKLQFLTGERTGETKQYLAGYGRALTPGKYSYNFVIQIIMTDLDSWEELLMNGGVHENPALLYAERDGTLHVNKSHEVGQIMFDLLGPGAIDRLTVDTRLTQDEHGQATIVRAYRPDMIKYLINLIEMCYGPYR